MNIPIMLALVTLATRGISEFFSKVAGAHQYYGPSYVFFQGVGLCVVGIVIHLVRRHPLDLSPKMTGVSILGGGLIAFGILAMVLAFSLGGEGSILFPITALAILVSVPLSFIFYNEPVTATKLVGLGFGIISIIFLSR